MCTFSTACAQNEVTSVAAFWADIPATQLLRTCVNRCLVLHIQNNCEYNCTYHIFQHYANTTMFITPQQQSTAVEISPFCHHRSSSECHVWPLSCNGHSLSWHHCAGQQQSGQTAPETVPYKCFTSTHRRSVSLSWTVFSPSATKNNNGCFVFTAWNHRASLFPHALIKPSNKCLSKGHITYRCLMRQQHTVLPWRQHTLTRDWLPSCSSRT